MTFKQGASAFGITNIITITVMVGSVVFNYAILTAKVDSLNERLTQEVIDRKVEDKAIRLEINQYYSRNSEQHTAILNALQVMQKDLTFHLGEHSGTEK